MLTDKLRKAQEELSSLPPVSTSFKSPSKGLSRIKRLQIDQHLEDLESYFLDRSTRGSRSGGGGGGQGILEGLSGFSQKSQLLPIGQIRHPDLHGSSAILSSIDFDRDDEYFATAGVTKVIKVYEFDHCFPDHHRLGKEGEDEEEDESGLHNHSRSNWSSNGHQGRVGRRQGSHQSFSLLPILEMPVNSKVR